MELRFEFGKNWQRFFSAIDEERIALAEASLRRRFDVATFEGKTFVDVGSGSGLFSLAARRLGAKVCSFDYDAESVACTEMVRAKWRERDPEWTVLRGSVLDSEFIGRIGTFDFVYAWGVLHHTGALMRAIDSASRLVRPGGSICMAVYNDQGGQSRRWLRLKHTYNVLPVALKLPFAVLVMGLREVRLALATSVSSGLGAYLKAIRDYSRTSERGMDYFTDIIDWIGGYPFEVAKPEDVFSAMKVRGFKLEQLKTCGGGLGCNEFVFTFES